MKIGIMQPYIFPYIGYFQLINSVDKFVIYDDVSFIKQGWINRNRILLNCNPHIFTLPLKNASSFQAINKTELNKTLYDGWLNKFVKTLEGAYAKAPHFKEAYPLICDVLKADAENISDVARLSIKEVCNYVGLKRDFVDTSAIYNNIDLRSAERVIDICRKEEGKTYINPIGGQELYSKEMFSEQGLELFFVQSKPMSYGQFKCEYVPWLSIIDLMMFLSKDEILSYFDNYQLV